MASQRILIADDEQMGRTTLQTLFAKEPYELEFAQDGPTALKLAASFDPDLILLDVMMPGMEGFEVCRLLRSDAKLSEVPIFLITALDDPQTKLSGLEAGADDFLSKPIDRAELRTRVRNLFQNNRYRKLLNERQAHRDHLNQLPMGVMILDSHGKELDSNQGMIPIRDLVFGDRSGPLGGLLGAEDSQRFASLLKSCAAKPYHTHRGDFSCKAKQGGFLWLELSVSARWTETDHLPKCLEYFVSVRDKTPEQIQETGQEDENHSCLINQVAMEVCREFSTVLNRIQKSTQMALAFLPPEESSRKDIEVIKETVDLALEMQKKFTDFAKPPDHLLKVWSLNHAVSDAMGLLGLTHRPQLPWKLTLGPEVGKVLLDAGQLRMALWDLMFRTQAFFPGGFGIEVETTLSPKSPQENSGHSRDHFRLTLRVLGAQPGKGILGKSHQGFPLDNETNPLDGWKLIPSMMAKHGGQWSIDRKGPTTMEIHLDFPRAGEPGDFFKGSGDSRSGQFPSFSLPGSPAGAAGNREPELVPDEESK